MSHGEIRASEDRPANRLSQETSPYLLQHAHNPVDWRPWSAATLKEAATLDKPVFLSVGYSTCHWCHVMAHESFEDDGVAAVMNEHFVCVKVDREELPDVDEQYMLATQLFTGRGGWPNSVVLTPDGRPWFAGTYFPKTRFVSLLLELSRVWKEQRAEVETQAERFAHAIRNAGKSGDAKQDVAVDMSLVDRACDYFRSIYDRANGGVGRAPKFPPHGALALWLDEQGRTGDLSAVSALTHTLDAMALGGIYDHIGGGFHRYSTDARWFLPHFEKMLYDNAQLLRAYAWAYRLTGHGGYGRVVAETFEWVQREMTDPAGGFYSALDADSEGEEGKFYVWTEREVRQVLGPEAGPFIAAYHITTEGTYHEEATGHATGANIPYLSKPQSPFAQERRKLLDARGRRVRPHLDDKVLASWNGLMIGALAEAGVWLNEPRYTQSAAKAAEFVLRAMRTREGKLLRTWRKGEPKIPAYLDDYACVIEGLLGLEAATGDSRWLEAARSLADVMIQDFFDPADGGFFMTSRDHDALLLRGKELGGGGNQPAGNGVAAGVLTTLACRTGDPRYADLAAATLQHFAPTVQSNPHGTEAIALAISRYLQADRLHPALKLAARLRSGRPASSGVAGQPPVTIRFDPSPRKVQPGDTFTLSLRCEVAEGFHVYAHDIAAQTMLIPTSVELVDSSVIRAEKTTWPRATEKPDPVLQSTLRTYSGAFEVQLGLAALPGAASGVHSLKLLFHAQACDDKACYPPVRYTIEIPVHVGGSTR